MSQIPMSEASIALNRFGMGGGPGYDLPGDPRLWLEAQLERSLGPLPTEGTSVEVLQAFDRYRDARKSQRQADNGTDAGEAVDQSRQALRSHFRDGVIARFQTMVASDAPFLERIAHFWSNHFAISASKQVVGPLAAAYENEAIRPHVLGKFEDMLVAVARHPAMLVYLDQARSIGPDSKMARRVRDRRQREIGLNENLAREILELHSMGVRSGYTQGDVKELAKALTGWTVPMLAPGRSLNGAEFEFLESLHEPGGRVLLGKRYDQGGEIQGLAMLRDIARSKETAAHLASKLARHFVADDPPQELVTRLADTYLVADGDLRAVFGELIAAEEAWDPRPRKFKTPIEWIVSTLRATRQPDQATKSAPRLARQLGQDLWAPGSPAGFADDTASWAGSDALFRRIEAAGVLARSADVADVLTLAEELFPNSISENTRRAIARSESPVQGLALLLSSPEAMWR